jgi:SSS family solute:Na+ symporter
VLAIVLYTKGIDFGGINLGLVCLGVNLATIGVFNTVIRSPKAVRVS